MIGAQCEDIFESMWQWAGHIWVELNAKLWITHLSKAQGEIVNWVECEVHIWDLLHNWYQTSSFSSSFIKYSQTIYHSVSKSSVWRARKLNRRTLNLYSFYVPKRWIRIHRKLLPISYSYRSWSGDNQATVLKIRGRRQKMLKRSIFVGWVTAAAEPAKIPFYKHHHREKQQFFKSLIASWSPICWWC